MAATARRRVDDDGRPGNAWTKCPLFCALSVCLIVPAWLPFAATAMPPTCDAGDVQLRLRGGGGSTGMARIGGSAGVNGLPGTMLRHPFGHGGFTRESMDADMLKGIEDGQPPDTAVETILSDRGTFPQPCLTLVQCMTLPGWLWPQVRNAWRPPQETNGERRNGSLRHGSTRWQSCRSIALIRRPSMHFRGMLTRTIHPLTHNCVIFPDVEPC